MALQSSLQWGTVSGVSNPSSVSLLKSKKVDISSDLRYHSVIKLLLCPFASILNCIVKGGYHCTAVLWSQTAIVSGSRIIPTSLQSHWNQSTVLKMCLCPIIKGFSLSNCNIMYIIEISGLWRKTNSSAFSALRSVMSCVLYGKYIVKLSSDSLSALTKFLMIQRGFSETKLQLDRPVARTKIC